MLAQIQPFLAAEVAYRRERLMANHPRVAASSTGTPESRGRNRRHLVPRLVRRAFVGH
jgi:hypothetical protein